MRTTVISRPPTRDEAKAEIDRHLREATYWLAGEMGMDERVRMAVGHLDRAIVRLKDLSDA